VLVPRKQPIPFSSRGPIDAVCRFLKGGKQTFIAMAKLAPQIEPMLASVVDEIVNMNPVLRKRVDLDQICRQKDIDPMHFLSVVSEAAMKYRDSAQIIIAALNMPSVVQASVKTALTRDGVKDRELLFKHSGFVPTPAGQKISILNQNAMKAEVNRDVEGGVRSFERTMTELDEAVED